jgi:uncharacterized membrane protein (DUF485 family)
MSYLEIVARRKKISIALSLLLIVGVIGFLVFACMFKKIAVYQIVPGLSLGIASAVFIILFSGALALFYACWMNYVYDKEISKLKE